MNEGGPGVCPERRSRPFLGKARDWRQYVPSNAALALDARRLDLSLLMNGRRSPAPGGGRRERRTATTPKRKKGCIQRESEVLRPARS